MNGFKQAYALPCNLRLLSHDDEEKFEFDTTDKHKVKYSASYAKYISP